MSRYLELKFTEGSGNTIKCVHMDKDFRLQGRFSPVWQGNKGLLFDGYSTYIPIELDNMLAYDQLYVEIWLAPRVYDDRSRTYGTELIEPIPDSSYKRLLKDLGIGFECIKIKEGFRLGLTPKGEIYLEIATSCGTQQLIGKRHPVPINVMSYIGVVFDKKTSKIKLYLNGNLIAQNLMPVGTTFNGGSGRYFIGGNADGADGFNGHCFYGNLAYLQISHKSMTDKEIFQRYADEKGKYFAYDKETIKKMMQEEGELFKTDWNRPVYHMIAPYHWMNEPHAPIYFEGVYHIFYQQNPKGPYWYHIHWGHLISEDLVHWEDVSMAISPQAGMIDQDGCWSGCATIDQKGLPLLVYTAGNNDMVPNQMIAYAYSTYDKNQDKCLMTWRKGNKPMVVQTKEQGDLGNFRDPFIFRVDNEYILLVGGSRGRDKGGTAFVYSSIDLDNWTYQGEFLESDYKSYPQSGPNWELPVFLPLGQDKDRKMKYIFLVCANEVPWDEVENYYWIGRYDRENYCFVPDSIEPQLLDLGGNHYTGPSGFVTPDGRSVLFSLVQGKRTFEEELNAGWAHNGALPVELALKKDGTLRLNPIKELVKRRKKKLLELKHTKSEALEEAMKGIHGDLLEILVVTRKNSGEEELNRLELTVRASEDGREKTVFLYDLDREVCELDRSKTTELSHPYCHGVNGGNVPVQEVIRLQVYLDKSMFEAYINEYRSLTSRLYPSIASAKGLTMTCNEGAVIDEIYIWEMG